MLKLYVLKIECWKYYCTILHIYIYIYLQVSIQLFKTVTLKIKSYQYGSLIGYKKISFRFMLSATPLT